MENSVYAYMIFNSLISRWVNSVCSTPNETRAAFTIVGSSPNVSKSST